ncbi:MAG: (2Fe-2S) ferredoxin domain-containing protein [Nitrospiraceae bacterium]|nr:(2Fe-2S) ferredoxin domain-containing protein [Nitrospiraceae bacterium]MDA8325167.1 (2Fe-2S) ferredoxin domain-containing protein [Nitrospiraceae bacterium]
MQKLTIDDLKKIKEQYAATFNLRQGGYKAKVTVHMGTCGIAAGARAVMNSIVEELASNDVKDVIVTASGCAGFCSKEPMATVELLGAAPVKYCYLNAEKMKRIFREHIQQGNIVEEYALVMGSETSY